MQVMVGLTVSAGFKAMRIQDGDGDGVLDRDDRCPDTTRGVRVNDRGCEWRESDTAAPTCGDTDLDGVCDGQDDCPDTRAKTPVDKKGCPIGGEKEPGSEE